MIRLLVVLLIGWCFVISVSAQDETGILALEQTYDEFEEAGFSIQGNYIIDMGIYDEGGYEGTPGWEIFIGGGSSSAFDAQMFKNFDYTSTDKTVWRLQYQVRAESSPYLITTSLRSLESPYLGFFYHTYIPAGFEKEWILVDYAFGPGAFYNAASSSLQFRMGNQPTQTLIVDNIRLYDSHVLASSSGFNLTNDKELNFFNGYTPPDGYEGRYNNSFELPVNNTHVEGVAVERVQEKGAADGVQFLRATITRPGSSLADSSISFVGKNDSRYTGAYRFNVSLRSNTVPLEIQGGLADSLLLNGERRTAPETVVIENQDTWVRASFLVPAGNFTGDDIFPFLRFGGQDQATVDIDRLFILKTDEAVVGVLPWEIY